MMYLFVDLNSYRQIIRLRPKVVDGIVENLKGLVEYSGGQCAFYENGTIVFAVDSESLGQSATSELIHHVFRVLYERRREIQGFAVVADEMDEVAEGTTVPVLGELRRLAMTAARTDTLWMGRRLWGLLGSDFAGEEDGELVRVLHKKADGPLSAADSRAFLTRAKVVTRIKRAIEKRLGGQGTGGWVRIVADHASGVDVSVRDALADLVGERRFERWACLGSGRDRLSPLEPFLDGIQPDFLASVPEYLSKSDGMLWEQRVGVLDFACPDFVAEDFFSIYSLYLLAYSRFMKRHQLPAVLIGLWVDQYPLATIRFLARLLGRFSGVGELLPICVTQGEESLGELEKTPHETITVGPLDSKEVQQRAAVFPALAPPRGEQLIEAAHGQPLFLYHACLLGRLGTKKGVQISMELLRQRDIACRRILYVTHLSGGLLSRWQIAGFLEETGLAEEVYKREFVNLVKLGYVDSGSGRLTDEKIGALIAAELGEELMEHQIADYCYSLWRAGRLSVTEPPPANPERLGALFWFLSRSGTFDQALLVFMELMGWLLDRGRVDEVLHYLEHEDLFRMELSAEETRRRDFFIELVSFRAAVLLQAREQADLRLVRLREMQPAGEWEKALLDLACAQHHYAAFEVKLALDAAKRALISAQAIESGLQECRADIEIGLTMLAGTRFEEAEEYFSLARSAVSEQQAVYEHIRSLTFEAIALFLFGNISRALTTAETAAAVAARSGRREWQRLALLVRGRCYFALGMYQEAEKVFRAGCSFCRIYPEDDAAKVFGAWAARSVAYGGEGNPFKHFEGLKRDAEVLLFLADYAAESGDLSTAAELVEESLDLQRGPSEEYSPSEIVPWHSGFAAIEDRALRRTDGKGVLYFNARAMRAYLKGMGREVDEAITEFARLTREERLSEHDPNNYYYYYLHSRIIPHGEGELLVDRLTVLSKALKDVQERATRIDDVKKRQSFLRRSRWNARLLEDAKELKLM